MKPKARILIVEDDSVIANIEEWRLKKLGYMICGRAASGTEALALVKEQKPDLVILDIDLEGEMDGIEIAEILDTQGTVPFIFLTGHGEEAIINRVKGTLQYGYIKKPFNDDDLNIGIELALAKKRVISNLLINNALYKMVLDHLPVGIIFTDNEGIIMYINENARSLTKWQDPPSVAHFREIVTIVDRTTGKPLENIFDRVTKEQSILWIPRNSALMTSEKEFLPVEGNATPFFNDAGEQEGMVVILYESRDVKYFKPLS